MEGPARRVEHAHVQGVGFGGSSERLPCLAIGIEYEDHAPESHGAIPRLARRKGHQGDVPAQAVGVDHGTVDVPENGHAEGIQLTRSEALWLRA
jgi:hypothetical protein